LAQDAVAVPYGNRGRKRVFYDLNVAALDCYIASNTALHI